jgi:hypothetical protein
VDLDLYVDLVLDANVVAVVLLYGVQVHDSVSD